MRRLLQSVADFLAREDGTTALEYAMVASLIFVVCLIAVNSLGANTNKTFSHCNSAITSAGS